MAADRAVGDVTAGKQIVLGSLSEIQPTLLDLNSDPIGTTSEEIDVKVVAGSLKISPAIDFWRVDHQQDTLTQNFTYAPAAEESVDFSTCNTAYLPMVGLPLDSDDVNFSTFNLQTYWRYRLCAMIYVDPKTFADRAEDEVLLTYKMPVSSFTTVGSYALPCLYLHTVATIADTISGIDSIKVPLKAELDTNDPTVWLMSGKVSLKAGINCFVLFLDTGPKTVSRSEYDNMKTKYGNLGLSFRSTQRLTGIKFNNSNDFVMAGPADPADASLYLKIVPYSKLSNQVSPQFYQAAVSEIEYSTGQASCQLYMNHPYFLFETGARLTPSTLLTGNAARVQYQQVEKLVKTTTLWAHMKRGTIMPIIKSFALRFSI